MTSGDSRKDNRVAVDWVGRVGRKGLGVSSVRIRNISLGGVYLESNQEFPLASHLLIEIEAEHNGDTRKILSEGSIMRVESTAGGEGYGYGIRFLRVRDDDLFHLLSIVAERWSAANAAAAERPAP
jgi:hypothetical protein